QQLEGFLAYHQVNVIIVAHHARDFGRDTDFFATRFNRDAIRFFAPLGINPMEAEDVLLYRLPSHGSSFREHSREATRFRAKHINNFGEPKRNKHNGRRQRIFATYRDQSVYLARWSNRQPWRLPVRMSARYTDHFGRREPAYVHQASERD